MWMRRRLRQQEVDTRRAARQVALIREVAPLLQQSLDLADVLPAVAVQLSDHFGLTGVRLSAGSTSAGQVELFALGDAPRPTRSEEHTSELQSLMRISYTVFY